MSEPVIEIHPRDGDWEVSEKAEQLVFPTLGGAITYARYRLLVCGGEIRVFDAAGKLDEIITSPPEGK